MEYRIDYAPRKKEFGIMLRVSGRRWGMGIAAVLLAGVLAINQFWPEGKIFVQKLIFPYGNAATSEAFETMVSELKNGSEFSDAAAAFCKTVISNAQIQD